MPVKKTMPVKKAVNVAIAKKKKLGKKYKFGTPSVVVGVRVPKVHRKKILQAIGLLLQEYIKKPDVKGGVPVVGKRIKKSFVQTEINI